MLIIEEREWNHIKCSIKPEKSTEKEGKTKKTQETKATDGEGADMEHLTPTLSWFTLDVSGTNIPVTRQKLSEWLKKIRPNYVLSARNPLKIHRHIKIKGQGVERDRPC